MKKYVSLKANKLIQNVSDDPQDGFLEVFVPDTQLKTLVEFPSACWVDSQNGTNVIHIPNKNDLPTDEFDDLKQNVEDATNNINQQQQTIANLKATINNMDVSSLQNTVNTLQKDVSNQPDDSDLKKQVAALGLAIVNLQKQQAAANQETAKASSNQPNNQATQNK